MAAKLKICGIRTPEIARVLDDINRQSGIIEFIGFVFCEQSPRHISLSEYEAICTLLTKRKSQLKKVIVTVNPSFGFLQEVVSYAKADYIQLHGDETASFAKSIKEQLGIAVIKAISIATAEDVKIAAQYESFCDYILFDAKPPIVKSDNNIDDKNQLRGGNAISFDWSILTPEKGFNPEYKWMLSGGISAQNILQAQAITKAKYFDLSSAVEETRGVKSANKIKEITEVLSQANQAYC